MGGGGTELVRLLEFPANSPAVTMGAIVLIVFLETPTLASSPTEAYGLPAIILFAVAAPTPGSVCRSLGLAVFKSRGGPRARLAGFFAAAPDTKVTPRMAQARKRET